MSIDEVRKLIEKDESRVLELKTSTSELVKGMQTLCAFLNSDGGWLFFGISPKLELWGQNVTDHTHRSFPQNPIIADALYMMAFLESWGTGVSRMVDECKSVGLPEPEYGTDGTFIWITFKRPNSVTNSVTNSDTNSDTNLVTDLVTNLVTFDSKSLSDRQKEILRYCMVARSSREILEHIGVTYHNKNIEKFIKTLVDAGLLVRTIPETPNSPKQKYITNRSRKNA